MNADAHTTHTAENVPRSLPLSIAVGPPGLAPGQAYAAPADGGALHVVDNVLGASAVLKGHERAAPAGRGGDGVDFAGAGEVVAEHLLRDGVVYAADKDCGIAGVRRVGSRLSYVRQAHITRGVD